MRQNMIILESLKKVAGYFLLTASVILAVACGRNEFDGEKELDCELKDVVLTFSRSEFVNADGTKSGMVGNSVVWEKGDQIALFIAKGYTNRYVLTLKDEDAGKTEGRFEGVIGTGTSYEYCAVYPADAVPERTYTAFLTSELPGVQEYKEGGFASGANISTRLIPATDLQSKYLTKSLNFSNALGILNLNITGTAKVNKIEVTTSSDKLAGAIGLFIKDFNDGGGLTILSDPLNTITLDCSKNGGVQLTSDGVDFNILLPPATMADGFIVTIYDSDGLTMVKGAGAHGENAIERSIITKMPQFAYVPAFSQLFTGTVFPCLVTNCNSKSAAIAKSFVADGNQTSFDGNNFYIQNMEKNFVVKYALPSSLTVGSSYDITVSHLIGTSSDSGISDGTLHLKYAGSDAAYARFVDETSNVGYTFNCQL